MRMDDVRERGLVLLGCGRMGGAMLRGWLARGVPPDAVSVLDPAPSDWLRGTDVHINDGVPSDPALAVVAVKPQMMDEALPSLVPLGGGRCLILSVAAGTPITRFEAALGEATPVVRAMPNTPAAIGRGITAIVGNHAAGEAGLDLAQDLLSAVGDVVRVDDEGLMDAVTGVSGSGPAYVFHLIEALAAAGADEGLPRELALKLARATVAGAGALAMETDEHPGDLRVAVTSPKGTTEAALRVLMDAETGFPGLLRRAVHASAERSRELGG